MPQPLDPAYLKAVGADDLLSVGSYAEAKRPSANPETQAGAYLAEKRKIVVV